MTRSPNLTGKPRIGITAGDPSGIGPEIVLKSVARPEVLSVCRPVIIGNRSHLLTHAGLLGLRCDYPYLSPASLSNLEAFDEALIIDSGEAGEPITPSTASAAGGKASIRSIETGVKLCLDGFLDGLATAPINKTALKLAGSPFPGHTEMLAHLCGSSQSLMCFFCGKLRVVLLSTHLSLLNAIKFISAERVTDAILLTEREMKRFNEHRPRIAVAGLNPHAGENGLFGDEEDLHIRPAIETCRRLHGINVDGPFPPDTVFARAARGEFDVIIACYHDQGLIAVKTLGFGKAVNVTLGLPIIRTSVDHGTAFDIAGRGIADPGSMIESILLAAGLVEAERKSEVGEAANFQ